MIARTLDVSPDRRTHRLTLAITSVSAFMIVVDTTIVNVALPSIKSDLHFAQTGLVWVVNAYMLTFGGSQLLAGRLADLHGQRRLFGIGVVIFTLASLACGLATTSAALVSARAVQGLGAALLSVVSLALITRTFPTTSERAKALGLFGFVSAVGGSVGPLLGGVLTDAFTWRWIFLVNVPIGAALCVLSLFLPSALRDRAVGRLDVWGAMAVTASLTLAIYAVVNSNGSWFSTETLRSLAAAVALFCIFVILERRVSSPMIPLEVFRRRSIAVANAVGVLWASALYAWFFISALYMQLVLGYDPIQVGLAFLPANLVMACASLMLSARIARWLGIPLALASGTLMGAIGLALFARAPADGALVDVLPGMICLGMGAGIVFNPIMLAVLKDVPPNASGIASGIFNTTRMLGGALGLAVLASLSAARTEALLASNTSARDALTAGYHVGFLVGALCAVLAAAIGLTLLRPAGSSARASTL